MGADPFNEAAVARIYEIKGRTSGKPILVLVSSLDQIDSVAEEFPPTAAALAQTFWPGPLTLVLRARPELPHLLTAGTGTIGVRFPRHDLARRLINDLHHPLTASSANLSGTENPTTARQVEEQLGNHVDLILDGGPTPGGKVSTLIDLTVSPPRFLREGAIGREEILKCLNGI